jgi:murein DD-endopeptidase MepM/ murein hydrolase activator NlpD
MAARGPTMFVSRARGVLILTTVLSTAHLTHAGQPTVASVACGETVVVRVSDAAPKQGAVVVVEARSEVPLVSVDGFYEGEALSFWNDADARVFQALVGVDLLAVPGATSLRARVVPESGAAVECRVDLRVDKGEFPVQRLEVAPKFVELSPEDLARSQRETAELNRIFSTTTPERLWRTGFQTPVGGYAPSGSFGKRRVFNDQPRSPHSGEDFSAPAGTPVRAPSRGRVVLAKSLFFLGNTVMLDHGFGLITFYGHLSSLAVEPGTIVESGAMIGEVGATGRVTGAHLHWGVRLAGARVDPNMLLIRIPLSR